MEGSDQMPLGRWIVNRLLTAAVLSCAAATAAFGADVGRTLVASNVLKLAADTARSTGEATLVKQFLVPYAGMVRVKWELKSDGTHTAFASVGSQIDTCPISENTLATFQSFSCDLRVVVGDIVQISAGGQNIAPDTFSTAVTRRARVFFKVVNASGKGITLPDEANPSAPPEAPDEAAAPPQPSAGGKS
jgi:hypothetical protein